MRQLLLASLVLLGAACASSSTKGGSSMASKQHTHDAQMRPEREELPRTGDLAKAALPYSILDARAGGREVSPDEFFATLAGAQALCLAEIHSNPHHHWAQLEVLRTLAERAGATVELALGMEMFERTMQGILDDYVAARIDEAALLERTSWEETWGIPFWMYQPMVALTRERNLPLLGLNAPKVLVKKVAHGGVDALSDADRKSLPTLDLTDAEHRAFFDEATSGHGMPGGGMDAFYAAQVVRDETMADVAARWLDAATPERPRLVVILAGQGHCVPSAIPKRLARRRPGPVITVQPVLAIEGEVARALAEPEADFLFVMRMPDTATDVH